MSELASRLRVSDDTIRRDLHVPAMSARYNVRLILAGGEWDVRQRLFSGASAVLQIAGCRADMAILGACAVHETLGVTDRARHLAGSRPALRVVSSTI